MKLTLRSLDGIHQIAKLTSYAIEERKETFLKQKDSILFTLPPICVMPVIIKEAK